MRRFSTTCRRNSCFVKSNKCGNTNVFHQKNSFSVSHSVSFNRHASILISGLTNTSGRPYLTSSNPQQQQQQTRNSFTNYQQVVCMENEIFSNKSLLSSSSGGSMISLLDLLDGEEDDDGC